MALKTHYQSLSEQCERDKAHAIQQLDHVQALLVEHLLQNSCFLESLQEMRLSYQGVIDQYARQASHARSQLIHVQALLADQLVLQYNQQRVSIQALTVNESPALTQTADPQADESPLPEAANETLLPDSDVPKETLSQQELTPPTPDAAVIVHSEPEHSPSDLTPSSPESKLDSRLLGPAPTQKGKQPKGQIRSPEAIRLLSAYSHYISFVDAIAAVLREHSGEIMTPGQVTKILFGDLLGMSEAKARKKVSRALWDGASRNHWQRLPGMNGRYTLDLRLL